MMEQADIAVDNYFAAERLREHSLENAGKALDTIVGLLESKHDSIRLDAAREILRLVSMDSKKSLR